MNLNLLNTLDYVIIIIIASSILISLMRGFVREALSLATWIVAIWVTLNFYAPLADMLRTYIAQEYVATGVAICILFVTALILGSMIGYLLSRMILVSGLGGTDRILGGLFGFARGALLIAVMILFAGMTSLQKESWWQESQLIPKFKPLASWIIDFLPNNERSFFSIAPIGGGATLSITTTAQDVTTTGQ